MARNKILLSDIINDFMLLHTDDDYVNNVNETQLKVLGRRGIREMGFDILQNVKSVLLPLNEDNITVNLPDDFVNWTRIGVVGDDGLFYIFKENNNIAAPMRYEYDVDGVTPKDTDGDGVNDRVDARIATDTNYPLQEAYYSNDGYIPNGGGQYGYGGAHYSGEFRINKEQNRIELDSHTDLTELAIEYIADEALGSNPSIHPFAADALDKYMYHRLVSRSTIVPYNEKIRAEREYGSALKTANSRLKSFTKDEALAQNRRNFRLSPKF